MPNHVNIPPAWDLDRLRYSTAKQWWQAAWNGISEIRVHAPPRKLAEKRSVYRQAVNQMEDCRRIRKLYRSQLMPETIRREEGDDSPQGQSDARSENVDIALGRSGGRHNLFCPLNSKDLYDQGQVTDETLYGYPFDVFFYVDLVNYLSVFVWITWYYRQSERLRGLSFSIQSDVYDDNLEAER